MTSTTGVVNGVILGEDINFTRGASDTATMNHDGYLLIGSSGTPSIVAGNLTAGTGISVVNSPGSITISTIGAGMTWSVVAVATALVANNGYFTNNGAGITFTLPATAAVGDTFRVVCMTGLWTIAQNASQYITTGVFTTTVGVGGSLVCLQVGSAIEIVCNVADVGFMVVSDKGNYTVN